MDEVDGKQLDEFIEKLDAVIQQYPNMAPHNISALLLSRVTLLMTMDPATGKELLKYVWTQLDEIEQANPGSMIP
jgi:hypothetical protein